MNEQRTSLCDQPVVFQLPDEGTVVVRRNVEYRVADGSARMMDIYAPAGSVGPMAAVVLVAGYPDDGFERLTGCQFKEMRHTKAWASLLAGAGLTAITYSNREPAGDLRALLKTIATQYADVYVDSSRLGIWATSGNVPTALGALRADFDLEIRCAAFLYGYLLDTDDTNHVQDAANVFRFANPRMHLDEVRWNVPTLIARAGQDQCPGLNVTIDRYIVEGLRRDLPLTVMNHPEAPHAFDLVHNSDTSRYIVRQTVGFLAAHLADHL